MIYVHISVMWLIEVFYRTDPNMKIVGVISIKMFIAYFLNFHFCYTSVLVVLVIIYLWKW